MRSLPVVCLMISIFRLISRKLVLSRRYHNIEIKTDGGNVFRIFRYIRLKDAERKNAGCVFLVSFKFAHLSHSVNKLTSIIPMLMIAGTPGFFAKIYAADTYDGYWQGMYQWDSIEHLNQYKKSFVFKMMKRRAIPESLSTVEIDNKSLIDFIETHRITS